MSIIQRVQHGPAGGNHTDHETRLVAVEALAQNLDWKASVRSASAAALPAYTRVGNVITADANGAITGHASVDGVAVAAGDRFFLQSAHAAAGADVGIYTWTQIGTAGTPWILTRAADANTSAEVTSNLAAQVEEGTAWGGRTLRITTTGAIVLNTTALTSAEMSRELTADVAGRARMATGFFTIAKVLDAFAADSMTVANVNAIFAADSFNNANLLKAIPNGAFAADDATRALFAADFLGATAIGRALIELGFFDAATVDDTFVDGAIGEDLLTADEIGHRPIQRVADSAAGAFAATAFAPDLVLKLDVADQASGNVDYTGAPASMGAYEVIDCWVRPTGTNGANANTIQLQTIAGVAITDAMSTNGVVDGGVVRATQILEPASEIAAAGGLRVAVVRAGGNVACDVFVRVIKRA